MTCYFRFRASLSSEYFDIPTNYKLRIGQKAYVMGFPLADLLGESMPSITEGIVSKDVGCLITQAIFN